MQWYYSKNATQLGPVTDEELRAKLASGEVTASDMVWKDGMPDWKPAASVPELGVMIPTQAVGAPNDPAYQQSPNAPPAYGAGPQVSAGKATASMVLGIVSLVFSLCGCYGIVISLPCAILAVVFGTQFKKEAESNPMLAAQLGPARAGVIMGWIAIGLLLLFTVGIMFFGFLGGMTGAFNG
jgi:hypothetical protein